MQLDDCILDICGPSMPSTGRRRLLAILVMIEQVQSIHLFIKAEMLDIDLPLRVESKSNHKTKLGLYKKAR